MNESFEDLYRRHRDWVVALAFRFCGNRDDALDVLQETFLYLSRKLPDLELNCAMRTFLYPVVKHLALGRKRREIPMAVPDREAPTPVPALVLSGLSELHQEVVYMRFADGMELQEIAEALGVPLGTVKSRLHNALEILRQRKIE